MFGNGPSLGDATSRKDEIASLDFASMAMSTFQVARDDLLRPIGKQLDMACLSHPAMVWSQVPALRQWLTESPEATLVLPLWARELAEVRGQPEFLLGESPSVFCYADHLPTPQDPLHVPPVNTLLFALFAGVLSRPRRIFLFGFDGQMKGSDTGKADALYFKENHEGYHQTGRERPEVRDLTRAWLLWDSRLFNEMATHVLRHAALLFDLPEVPIYNVCPDSALKVYPRITFDRFLQLASE